MSPVVRAGARARGHAPGGAHHGTEPYKRCATLRCSGASPTTSAFRPHTAARSEGEDA